MNEDDATKYVLDRTRSYEVDYLYKYREINSKGLESTITNGEIFFPDPTRFNDPFDCKPKVGVHNSEYKRNKYYKELIKSKRPHLTSHQIKKEIRSNPLIKKLRNAKYLDELVLKLIKSYGIYCLTEVPDDILMWSHYSASHTGVCLQFNAKEELSVFWEAYMVTYQEKYPEVNVMEIGEYKQFFNLFATKSQHWEYERERRVIRDENDGGSKIYTFDTILSPLVIIAFTPFISPCVACLISTSHGSPPMPARSQCIGKLCPFGS